MATDGIHRGTVFDVDIDEGSDECSSQLTATGNHISEADCLQLLLEVLQNRIRKRHSEITKELTAELDSDKNGEEEEESISTIDTEED